MGRAKERFGAFLDSEKYVPYHVADAAGSEDEQADSREAIAVGDSKSQWITSPKVGKYSGTKCNRHQQESAVEKGVPRCEK